MGKISAMERNQTGKKERMPGLSKVIRDSSLKRRHRRKDLKKGRERAMRTCGEEQQSTGLQGGPGLAWPGLGTTRSISELGMEGDDEM